MATKKQAKKRDEALAGIDDFTSTPESPAVQISYSTTGKLQDQKIHFSKE